MCTPSIFLRLSRLTAVPPPQAGFNHGGSLSYGWPRGLSAVFSHGHANVAELAPSRGCRVADDQLFRSIRSRGVRLIENGADVDKYAGRRRPIRPRSDRPSSQQVPRPRDRLSCLALDRSAMVALYSHGLGMFRKVFGSRKSGARRQSRDRRSRRRAYSQDHGALFGLYQRLRLAGVWVRPGGGAPRGAWPVVAHPDVFAPGRQEPHRSDFEDADAAACKFRPTGTQSHRPRSQPAHRHGGSGGVQVVGGQQAVRGVLRAVLGPNVRTILDVPIPRSITGGIDLLDRHFDRKTPAIVVFANAHTLNSTATDRRVQSILDHSIVFNDGIGVDLASRLLFGKAFPENLNGTDFVPHYLRQSKNRYRIFLLGGRPGVATKAAGRLAKWRRSMTSSAQATATSRRKIPRCR